jgi:hypothetical protein
MHELQVERRQRPDRRSGAERRLEERRMLVDRRKMALRRRVHESAGVHIRHAMQVLTRLEALAPTEETREDFRVANQRLWLAFQELAPAKSTSHRGRWLALMSLAGVAAAGVVFVSLSRGAAGARDPAGAGTPIAAPAAAEASPAPAALVAARDSVAARSSAFDQRAEALATALQTYGDRFGLFERQQLNCAALESAFVAVNERWITYGLDRKRLAAPLNAARAAADRSFYAAVDSTEGRQDRSGCPRP